MMTDLNKLEIVHLCTIYSTISDYRQYINSATLKTRFYSRFNHPGPSLLRKETPKYEWS